MVKNTEFLSKRTRMREFESKVGGGGKVEFCCYSGPKYQFLKTFSRIFLDGPCLVIVVGEIYAS